MPDHFDLIAPYYDRIFHRQSVQALTNHVAPQANHRLLDVGGGTGRIAQYFVKHVHQVCILDPSPGMLQEGQQKGLCITQGMAERIPFADQTFDRIIAIDSFHHLLNQRQAARELLRVLAPGGRLIVEEPNIAHCAVKLIALGEKLLMMRSHFLSAAKMRSLFEQNGAQVTIEEENTTLWLIISKPLQAYQ